MLDLGRSRALALVFGTLHVGALLLALLLPLSLWIRAGLVVMVVYSGYQVLRGHAFRSSPRAITGLALTDNDGCEVRLAHGEWLPGRITDRWVQPWLTIVMVRRMERRGRLAVLVPADAVNAERFRRLRVRLRLRSAAG